MASGKTTGPVPVKAVHSKRKRGAYDDSLSPQHWQSPSPVRLRRNPKRRCTQARSEGLHLGGTLATTVRKLSPPRPKPGTDKPTLPVTPPTDISLVSTSLLKLHQESHIPHPRPASPPISSGPVSSALDDRLVLVVHRLSPLWCSPDNYDCYDPEFGAKVSSAYERHLKRSLRLDALEQCWRRQRYGTPIAEAFEIGDTPQEVRDEYERKQEEGIRQWLEMAAESTDESDAEGPAEPSTTEAARESKDENAPVSVKVG